VRERARASRRQPSRLVCQRREGAYATPREVPRVTSGERGPRETAKHLRCRDMIRKGGTVRYKQEATTGSSDGGIPAKSSSACRKTAHRARRAVQFDLVANPCSFVCVPVVDGAPEKGHAQRKIRVRAKGAMSRYSLADRCRAVVKPCSNEGESHSRCFTRIPPSSTCGYGSVRLAPHLSDSHGCRAPHTPATTLPCGRQAPCDRRQFQNSSAQTARGPTIQVISLATCASIETVGSASEHHSWK